jgi:hypothetical protein
MASMSPEKQKIEELLENGEVKQIMEILSKSKSNDDLVNGKYTSSGFSLLHYAADTNDVGFVNFLLEKGANPFAKDSHGNAVVDSCNEQTKPKVFALLNAAMSAYQQQSEDAPGSKSSSEGAIALALANSSLKDKQQTLKDLEAAGDIAKLQVKETEAQLESLANEIEKVKADIKKTQDELGSVVQELEIGKGLPSPMPPPYWKIKKIINQGIVTHDIKDAALLQGFQHLMNKTCTLSALGKGLDQLCKMSYSSLVVKRVTRIENPRVWMAYQQHGQQFTLDLAGKAAPLLPTDAITLNHLPGVMESGLEAKHNEVYLWHGTGPEIVPLITVGGFDERVCSLNGLFGAGIYFAEHCSKSDQYCTPDSTNTFFIFLARVRLGSQGKVSICQAGARRPPPKVPGGQELHDSLLGQTAPNKYREFVVYDRCKCYPEYVIQYERK